MTSDSYSNNAHKDEVPKPAELLTDIRIAAATPARLLAIWNNRFQEDALWRQATAATYEALARRLLAASAPLVALEVATVGLEFWPTHILLRQLKGLALARSGATQDAEASLAAVWDEIKTRTEIDKFIVEETLGTLARVYKDQALAASDVTLRRELWTQARDLYGEAFRLTNGYWTGINAATLSTLLGERSHAEALATQVYGQCQKSLAKNGGAGDDPYWLVATLAEASLNLLWWDDAERYYCEAGRVGSKRQGDLNATRKQARLLLTNLQRDVGVLDQWLPVSRVVVFAGHMLDRPDRIEERFPPRLNATVKVAIKEWLQQNNALVGFSSAASGSDILFQEALAELGGEPYVVLPYGAEQFLHDSVAIRGHQENESWAQRYHEVLRRAARIVQSSSTQLFFESASYDFADQLLHGLATVRSLELETELLGLAVWDGRPGDGLGGTASAVARWHQFGIAVYRVDLARLPVDGNERLIVIKDPIPSTPMPAPEEHAPPSTEYAVSALLFADAEGFSKLTDPEVPLFVKEFLGRVAALAQEQDDAISVRETWGDGLFFAFRSVEVAGSFALDLADEVNSTDWQSLGFSHPLRIRIALHAGPVHYGVDPITGLPKCSGTHVSRAARLEPKTPPGQVYASEAFAALAALEGVKAFSCDYVKQLPWAKHYGTFPAYVVRRTKLLKTEETYRVSSAR